MNIYMDAAAERVEYRGDALLKINRMISERNMIFEDLEVAERPGADGAASGRSLFQAAVIALTAARRTLREDNEYDISQIASLLVRDELAPAARESDQPVVFVTSNAFYPALRSFAVCEIVWNLDVIDPSAMMFQHLVEQIELQCANQGIYLGSPEYDNSLYVVDLRRWEYIAEDFEGGDDLNDEWRGL